GHLRQLARRATPHADDIGWKPRHVDIRPAGVPRRRHIVDDRLPAETDTTQDAAMAAGRDIAAGTRIAFLHFARGEDLLLLDQHEPGAVPAAIVRPDAGSDEID